MKQGQRTLLAFDFGLRDIGVAAGQELTATSTPLETLRTIHEKPDWDAITRLINDWKPDALVVGIPLSMDDSEQEMTHAARRFVRQLTGRYHLPVYEADERLTSIEAAQLIHEHDSEGRRPRRKRGIDEVAAHIILQTWLSQDQDDR